MVDTLMRSYHIPKWVNGANFAEKEQYPRALGVTVFAQKSEFQTKETCITVQPLIVTPLII